MKSRIWQQIGRMALAGGVLVLAACAQTPARFEFAAQSETVGERIWPEPPQQPRYRYVGQLTGADNFKRPVEEAGNGGVQFLRWLVGLNRRSRQTVVLQRPQAGVVDGNGVIYVSDISRQAVYVFDPAHNRLQVWDEATEGLRFEVPVGVAIGRDGELLVADASLGVVARLSPQGVGAGLIGLGMLEHPAGVARDAVSGRIYVADRGANNIKVFTDDGEHILTFGEFGEGEGQLNGPTYVAWKAGRLYVTDTLNSRIQVFGPDGVYLSGFGRRGIFVGDLPRPKGLALDSDDNIYVVESYYDHLLIFNENGELLLPIGGTGYEIGQFYLPAGVWTDSQDRIYVADMFNGRVVVFQYLGGEDGSNPEAGRSVDHRRAAGV